MTTLDNIITLAVAGAAIAAVWAAWRNDMLDIHGMINGIRIYESPLAVTFEPVKQHVKSNSMSYSYHKRVQKKWNRRWGKKAVPGMYRTPQGIVAHPEIVAQLRGEIQ